MLYCIFCVGSLYTNPPKQVGAVGGEVGFAAH